MGADLKAEELTAIVQGIRDRVRAQYPEGAAAGVALPDLTPVLHARDAAEGKVASIGSVNPRPPGLLNSITQSAKKLISRAMDWHVREQVEYNRAVVNALDAILEALNENNRALAAFGARADEAQKSLDARADRLQKNLDARAEEYQVVHDIHTHWSAWHVEWERKLTDIESRFLRTVAELQAAFQHRTTLMETTTRDLVKTQHADFSMALERGILETQKRLWEDLKRVRAEFERTIHTELRLIRQRSALEPPQPAAPPVESAQAGPAIDWLHFAERFRGSEDYVREKQRFYMPYFQGCMEVLDIGCGRGEFLDLAKEAGIPARGIDLSAESVALCRSRGLTAEAADLFVHLDSLPDRALGGIFCAQVIEHLPPSRLPEMLRLACAKLATGGVLALETPNPECLAIFASHFYIDPTHQHPVPPQLLAFYLEEFGMGAIETHRLSPAAESMKAVASLPDDFREAFFGALDYAVIAKKL